MKLAFDGEEEISIDPQTVPPVRAALLLQTTAVYLHSCKELCRENIYFTEKVEKIKQGLDALYGRLVEGYGEAAAAHFLADTNLKIQLAQ